MATYYHGSDNADLTLDDIFDGICLTDDADAALCYGEHLYEIEIADVEIESVGADGECGWYPGDTDTYAYAERGVQAISYQDWTPDNTRDHETVRVIDTAIITGWQLLA